MTKGFWFIIGLFVLYGLVNWVHEVQFLRGNVWHEHDIMTKDDLTLKVDFLGLRVSQFVTRTVGGVFTVILIVFICLAVRQQRLENRVRELESSRHL